MDRNFKLTLVGTLLLIVMASQHGYSEASSDTKSPYTARYAQKYGEAYKNKFGIYSTPVVNEIPKSLSRIVKKNMPISALAEHYGVSHFTMSCPGNSFLMGIQSDYSRDFDDVAYRTFSFKCAFLENDKGELLQKKSCDSDFKPENPKGEKGVSTCLDSAFIAGFQYKKFFDADYQGDLQYKSECCSLADSHQQVVKPLNECKTFDYVAGSNIDMTCPQDMIVSRIVSFYHDKDRDRAFKFTCCKAGAQ